MSRDVIQFTGEFRLEEALVTSPTGEVTDLMTDLQIVEINLFESLIRNTISGSIIVVDTRNVVVKLPIVGQEDLSLKIVTPSLKKKEGKISGEELNEYLNKYINPSGTDPILIQSIIIMNGIQLYFFPQIN